MSSTNNEFYENFKKYFSTPTENKSLRIQNKSPENKIQKFLINKKINDTNIETEDYTNSISSNEKKERKVFCDKNSTNKIGLPKKKLKILKNREPFSENNFFQDKSKEIKNKTSKLLNMKRQHKENSSKINKKFLFNENFFQTQNFLSDSNFDLIFFTNSQKKENLRKCLKIKSEKDMIEKEFLEFYLNSLGETDFCDKQKIKNSEKVTKINDLFKIVKVRQNNLKNLNHEELHVENTNEITNSNLYQCVFKDCEHFDFDMEDWEKHYESHVKTF